jgi:hypothetical protein
MDTSQIIVSANEPTGGNPNKAGKTGRRHGPVLPVQPKMDIRRNKPCPCGSGRKAKKCCLARIQMMAALPPVVRTQVIVAGVLGHWPTTEPPAPIPEAVQQRFRDLVAEQATKKVIPFESGLIQSGDTTIETGPGTLTHTTENTDAATTLPPTATDPPAA